MSDICDLLVVCVVILGPLWLILNYKSKSHNAVQRSAADADSLNRMSATAQRLEDRVANLEHILDAELPAWRGNFNEGAAPYGKVG